MKFSCQPTSFNDTLPRIRHAQPDQALRWLRAGWHDVRANPLPSLAYGLLFALAGDLIILALLEHPHLLTVAISAFFLVAPLLSAGLYVLSRALENGERPFFVDSIKGLRRNGQSLAIFGLILALIALFWERVTAVAFALIAIDSSASASAFLGEILFSGEHLAFILTWFALGGLLALFVFALTVVSVPLMLDRDCDVATAMVTSVRAFTQNGPPLLLWSGIIVGLTLLGFATALFGLVLIMPILGHASWHAYRDLVE